MFKSFRALHRRALAAERQGVIFQPISGREGAGSKPNNGQSGFRTGRAATRERVKPLRLYRAVEPDQNGEKCRHPIRRELSSVIARSSSLVNGVQDLETTQLDGSEQMASQPERHQEEQINEHIMTFVTQWTSENVNVEHYEPSDGIINPLLEKLINDAPAEGITAEQLVDVCGTPRDIVTEALSERMEEEKKRRMDKDPEVEIVTVTALQR